MAEHTPIEWPRQHRQRSHGGRRLRAGGPKRGIRLCYAGLDIERKVAKGPRKGWPLAFNQPTLFPGRIAEAAHWHDLTGTKRRDKPWLDGMPRLIFVVDMGDAFTKSIPLDWLAPELPIMAQSPHRWLLLTKRPERMAEFSLRHQWPENVW